ncbi:FAD-dependent oxidoreductase [Devosia oryziradicis]|uniref:FAD-dependent oxidoreductase n=1 Tax=Devosia oryziradicis TaxID=2801335 RepID=A0ABX7BYZ9_9HYPH|nr:FAD-dependent oxidoreductase [Devosia oryziradicis]QQR37041.1 FAD-dependent oxidoreductase [Devosia oryziradicis]
MHHDHHPDLSHHRRIAVIGAGVAGLSAAWLLSRKHEVTLYEKEDWLGGHAHTVDVETAGGRMAIDTGFIVYNTDNYPNFTALLQHLEVASVETHMSFAASVGAGRFEYSSDFRGLIGQKRNLARPGYWQMLADIVRFYAHAESLIDSPEIEGMTLGGFLDKHGYSTHLVDLHILPMCAAIWSSSADAIRGFPMRAFVRFFSSHELFKLGRRALWRTVKGGSRSYVAAMVRDFGGKVRQAPAARAISRQAGLVTVEDVHGGRDVFTDVIMASHADQTLAMLDDADGLEREVLGAFSYTHNRAVLHDDPSLMPQRKAVWASWNYIGGPDDAGADALCVTYWMNRLQNLDRRHPIFVTLNPSREPRKSAVLRSYDYEHPLFNQPALTAQKRLWELQGRRGTWFCGSYFGYGFHEDGLQSGLAVAENFGVTRPWVRPVNRIAEAPVQLQAAE